MWPFNRKKTEPITIDIEKVKEAVEYERAQWRKLADFHKEEAEKAHERYSRAMEQVPFLEFVLGNRDTGWCWGGLIQSFPELQVGTIITLNYQGADTKFKISSFDKFTNNTLRFYILLYEPKNQ